MSEQDKGAKKSGISRREFLKKAGLASGGVAVGSTVLSACTLPKETIKTVEVPGPVQIKEVIKEVPGPVQVKEVPGPVQIKEVAFKAPLATGYLVYDQKKCQGCSTCMMVCSAVNEGKSSLSLARLQRTRNMLGIFPTDITSQVCRQCVYVPCIEACPSGAFYLDKENGNVRTIDRAKCAAYQKSIAPKVCQACVEACPYVPSMAVWNPTVTEGGIKGVAMVCDLCKSAKDWSGGGVNGKQACVEVCPNQCIKMVKELPSSTVGYDVNMRTQEWQNLMNQSWPKAG